MKNYEGDICQVKKCICYNGECIGGRCVCAKGYYGEDCSKRKCKICLNGICDSSTGKCKCFPKYEGEFCEKETCLCKNNGTCDDKGKCICTSEFYGKNCEIKRCKRNCNGIKY